MTSYDRYDFGSLRDWLYFCTQVQEEAEAEFAPGPEETTLLREHVDEIQQAARMLASALDSYDDALVLANLWLSWYGGDRWRLVPVIDKRTAAHRKCK